MSQSLPVKMAIKTIYATLNINDQKIADFILENPNFIATSTINDVASKIGIANSTFYQFTRKLGFSGYKSFQIALVKEQAAISKNDSSKAPDELKNFFSEIIQNIKDSQNYFSIIKLSAILDLIEESEKIYLIYSENSEIIARYSYTKFLNKGISCSFTSNFFLQKKLLMHATKKDCILFFLSFSDSDADSIHELIQLIEKKDSNLILFSNTLVNEISTSSMIFIPSFSNTMDNKDIDFSVTVFYMAIIEIICKHIFK